MLEVISITSPEEQDLIVDYSGRSIIFEFRWNDVLKYWYFNLKENDVYIATGISCRAINSNLLYDKYKLGKLYLVDTLQGETSRPIVKEDLGKRLALIRDYA